MEKVFEENVECDGIYIVLSGEFMTYKSFVFDKENSDLNKNMSHSLLKSNLQLKLTENRDIKLKILGANELFGEEDMLDVTDLLKYEEETCFNFK
jgi:CRP-like cAMP-binding protein